MEELAQVGKVAWLQSGFVDESLKCSMGSSAMALGTKVRGQRVAAGGRKRVARTAVEAVWYQGLRETKLLFISYLWPRWL
jgi:hypothetical protein